jgi:cytochrome c peroxidase
LEDQLDGPINNADEMGGNWKLIVSRLKLDRAMVEEFQKAYKSEPNEKNIKDAIASFERSLVLVNSPFDRYLLGDRAAITQTAERGYTLFKDLGCASCHQGQSVGGNMFQKFGIIKDYFQARGDISDVDLGRYSLTKDEDDRYVFKVPSLRNIDLTSPYFHDGSAETLEKAVDIMAEYQLGHTLSVKDREDIVAFLRSLTGEMPPP